MCLGFDVGCCFGLGGRGTDDHFGTTTPKGGGVGVTTHQYNTGVPAKATTPYHGAAADRNGRQGAAYQTNGYKVPPSYGYDQPKPPAAAAAVEEAHKASHDARRGGHNHTWPAAGAGAGGHERAYVYSGANGTLGGTQPAMNPMVAVDGAAYSYPNYGYGRAHGQYY